jgi:hypothetical protein
MCRCTLVAVTPAAVRPVPARRRLHRQPHPAAPAAAPGSLHSPRRSAAGLPARLAMTVGCVPPDRRKPRTRAMVQQ